MRFDEIDWQFLTPDTASHAMQAQGLWVCGPDTLQGTALLSVAYPALQSIAGDHVMTRLSELPQ